jgi:tryptophan-rich sensory protein
MKIQKPLKLVFLIILCEIIGSLGSIFTLPNITGWYANLAKPFFSPPNWLFGPVWTILFLLMGVAFYLILEAKNASKSKNKNSKANEKYSPQQKTAITLFGIQFFFNVLWSYLFFGLKSPFLGFVGIIFLWLSIVVTIISFYQVSKKSAYLLVSYILWVSFAGILNFSVMILNP